MARLVARGMDAVERFWGRPFSRGFEVRVLANRAALDRFWRGLWKEPAFKSACWMVASGQDEVMALLNPVAWKEQACDHDPDDAGHLQNLVTHELAHVYHDHQNRLVGFTGGEPIGWFIEGVAVLVSGQLAEKKRFTAAQAIKDGRAPRRLTNAWSGKYRYGVSGSLVAYLDHTLGRPRLRSLLAATSPAELLAGIGMTEDELLQGWQRWVVSASSPAHQGAGVARNVAQNIQLLNKTCGCISLALVLAPALALPFPSTSWCPFRCPGPFGFEPSG